MMRCTYCNNRATQKVAGLNVCNNPKHEARVTAFFAHPDRRCYYCTEPVRANTGVEVDGAAAHTSCHKEACS